MAMGYTISSLDSNESILEKLNKIEKYLKDNPLCNLYVSKQTYPTGANYILYSNILNSNIRPLINNGDLILFKNGFVGMVTAVDIDNDMVYYDNDNVVQIADGDHYVTGVEVINPTPTTAQIKIDIAGSTSEYSNTFSIGGGSGISTIQVNESSGTAQIVITDTDNVQHTSNSFTVGEQNTDTLIDTITVTESNGTATITITDTANHSYTSNSFNVGGGGAETVYVDANKDSISSDLTTGTYGNKTINLGKNCNSETDYGIVIGYGSHIRTPDTILIGMDNISGNNVNDTGSINIGIGHHIHFEHSKKNIMIGSSCELSIQSHNNVHIGEFTNGNSFILQSVSNTISIGFDAFVSADNTIQLGTGTNSTPNSIQFKSHQIASEESTTLKLSNELQINNHLITIISVTNDFATASANGVQVTVDQNDSTHEQVQNLNHPTTDTSILEDEQVLAIYNYTDMTDPDNPVSEFTLCYAMFVNYDSVNNICDCMVLRMGPTQTM